MLPFLKKFDVIYWKDNRKLVVTNKVQLTIDKVHHAALWRVDFVSIGQGSIPDINIRNYWYYIDGRTFDRQCCYADIVKVEPYIPKERELFFEIKL